MDERYVKLTHVPLLLPLARSLSLVLSLLLVACATTQSGREAASAAQPPSAKTTGDMGTALSAAPEQPAERSKLYRGTGVLIQGQEEGGAVKLQPMPPAPPGPAVTLNFEGADIREVARNILGDILNESYAIDPAVGGTVTIRTTSGIPREALPATMEMLLRMNGATMTKQGGIWKILPAAAAVRGNVTPQLGSTSRALQPGFSVLIVPLHYVGVRQMATLLEPFVKDQTTVRVDDLRNLLILSGTELELKHLLATVEMFDINWMAGMSAGLFTLQSADVKSVTAELDKALGTPDKSPLAGILRIIPIERMNALLIITPQPEYLEEAKKWIERLDKAGTDSAGVRFYVYQVQYSRAERIGPLLQQAFTGRVTQQPTPSAPVQVVADKDNNTVLIVATPTEYAVIEAALKKLDIPQRQVAIEVTIASVVLGDSIQFGVEWLFKGAAPSGRGAGGLFNNTTAFNPGAPATTTNSSATNNPALSLAQGFVYLINNANFPGGIQAVLHVLDTYGNTKVISNPHLAALDNQKATIKVGDRIPICQQAFVGATVGTTNAVTTTSQYIDTGVLLQVTPHINAGGLVTLDVQAEVSTPGAISASCDQPPTIATRSVQTLVAVPTGQTMVMGGLISEDKENSSKGLPLISRVPILGGLFGNQNLTSNRTELVLFITPRVVDNEADIGRVIDDMRRKMERLDDVFPKPKTVTDAASAAPPTVVK